MDTEGQVYGPLIFTIRIFAFCTIDFPVPKIFKKMCLPTIHVDVCHFPGIGHTHQAPPPILLQDGHVGRNVMEVAVDLVFSVFDPHSSKYAHCLSSFNISA